MAIKTLAVKYRPNKFSDVVEQTEAKAILMQQLESGEIKNAYLFCGGAGTGKTTCARIFAEEINHQQGNPIEIDAASNSSVDDVREIITQAKTRSLDSEYKIFIVDECHSLSSTAWQALLKLIEEPPAKSIFIFCTTDPQKIPKTILSRVQRYDFRRISNAGIHDRLVHIINAQQNEENEFYNVDDEAIQYIAKLADGGMRDAITMLDKCLSYSKELSLTNVADALGTPDYTMMFDLTDALLGEDVANIIKCIESVHMAGKDVKQFIKLYTTFVLDVMKYKYLGSFEYLEIPSTYKDMLAKYKYKDFNHLLDTLIKLNADIKWSTSPKPVVESVLVVESSYYGRTE